MRRNRCLVSSTQSIAVLVGLIVFPSVAQGDAYAWGGRVDRLRIDMVVSGFNDGAGTNVWELPNARYFALFGKHISKAIPAGRFIHVMGNSDDYYPIKIRVHHCGQTQCPGKLLTEYSTKLKPFIDLFV